MTLPATPPITLAQVRAEFGAPAGTPLHAFLRGGAWVPNITQNNAVPTVLPIRLAQLCGATKYVPMVIGGPSPVYWDGDAFKPPRKFYTSSGATVTGGNPAKTYAWTFVSGSTQINCDVSNTLAGSFWAYGPVDLGTGGEPDTHFVAVWRITISDGTASVHRDVTFDFTGFGGAP